MKKIFALLLGAVMSISVLTPALAACDGGEDAHEHSVANWTQTKAPTCTEEGEEKGRRDLHGGRAAHRPLSRMRSRRRG